MRRPFAIFLYLLFSLAPAVQAAAQTCYLFIGSYNWDKEQTGLYVYAYDTVSGNMRLVSSLAGILNPGFLAASPDGTMLYACTEAHTANAGKVSSFRFDPATGKLSFVNAQGSGGENPVYLTVHKSGRWLVNANYTGGTVSVFPLLGDGSIGAASQVISFTGRSINKERQEMPHIHSAVFDPAQDHIFLPDLGADKIRCFNFAADSDQPLTPEDTPFTLTEPGGGPRHFVFSPNGQFCYCVEEMGGAITAYAYTPGKLTQLQRLPIHRTKRKSIFSSADIHFSPDGRFLYASNRGAENNIAILSASPATGMLKVVGYQSTLGDHPRNFTLDPAGNFLLVANQVSGDVIVFKRNAATGLLTPTGTKVLVRGASCLLMKEYDE